MDEILFKDLEEKQAHYKNAANMDNNQFADAYAHLPETMKQNQKNKRDLVDNQVFSGNLEKTNQDKFLDYSHDYVLENVKDRVMFANGKVFANIQTYGKAEVTEEDKSILGKLKSLKNFVSNAFQATRNASLVDKVFTKAGQKAEIFQELAGTKNEFSDFGTGTMLKRLCDYTEFHGKYLSAQGKKEKIINDNPYFRDLIKDRVEGKYGKEGDDLKKKLFTKYRFSVIPFLQTYKKGWFGRYYNLDGKRIKVKSGEKNPADYNKEVLKCLMLETEKGKTKDTKKKKADQVLAENRQKKAAVLTKITKDLIEESEKFDVSKMNDRYVVEHITELQAYRDRLHAFLLLYQDNRWFFYGKDFSQEKLKTLTPADAADPQFINLVNTRIIDMAHPVSTFLESHMAIHGVRNNQQIAGRKNGFRTVISNQEKQRMSLVGESAAKTQEFALVRTRMSGADISESTDRMGQFGNDFDVVDMSVMTEEEKKEYRDQVNAEKSFVESKACVSFLAQSVEELQNKANRPLSKDVTGAINKELTEIRKTNKQRFEDDNAGKPDSKKLTYFPGAYVSDGVAEVSESYIRMSTLKERINSELGRDMYMSYGPELDHLYAKFYEAARLEGELSERKRALNKKFKFSTIRNEENELKTNKNKLTIKDLKKRVEDKKKANKKVFAAKQSSNPYATFVQDLLAEKRLVRAEQEYDEIDKKLAFVKYNLKVCYNSMMYFLGNPEEKQGSEESFSEVSTFLRKENLSYMVELDRVESSDRLLDEALGLTEQDWQREAGNEPGAVRPKIRVHRDIKERAARIYLVRRKGREHEQTRKGLDQFKEKTANKSEIQSFADLCAMPADKFVNLKTANFLAMDNAKNQETAFPIILHTGLRSMGRNKPNSYYNATVFTNVRAMKQLHEHLLAQNYAVKQNLMEFMADIKAKIEMIDTATTYVNVELGERRERSTIFIDTERINELDLASLRKLLTHLKEKEKVLEQAAAQKPLVTNEMGLPLVDAKQPYLTRKAHNELKNCKNLIKYVEDHKIKIESLAEYDNFGEQTFQSKYSNCLKEARINIAKREEYINADAEYLEHKDMMEDELTQPLLKPMYAGIYEKTSKDKKLLNDEKYMTDQMMKIVVAIRELTLDRNMIEEVKSNFGFGHKPSADVYRKYLRYLRVVNKARDMVDMSPEFQDDFTKKIVECMKKEKLFDEFAKTYKRIAPIYEMMNGYAESLGFISATSNYAKVGWSGEDVENSENPEETEEKISDEAQKAKDKSIRASEAFVKNIEEAVKEEEDKKKAALEADRQKRQAEDDQKFGKDAIPKVFERLYKAGLQLSIHQADKWKKELEKLCKDTSKNKSGEERWIKIAAQMLLDDWPYTFDNFVAYRAEKDAAEAIRTTLRRFAGKFGSAYTDEDHAAQIAGVIAKSENAGYSAITLEKRKQLDKALKTAGLDAHEFKKLFENVEVNGAGMPRNFEAESARISNTSFANDFINRYKDGKDEKTSKSLYDWNNRIISKFRQVAYFEINAEMLDPKYIKQHFAILYEKCKSFKILQELYNKDFKDHPEIFENHKVPGRLQVMIQNAFGVEKNNLFKHFYDAIEAYASMHFVDKEGRFDMGLKNDEINSDKITSDQMRLKIAKVTDERTKKFEKIAGDVRRDLDQRTIASKIAKADEINQTLKTFKVESNDNLFKMVQRGDFEGKMDDINLMIQTDTLSDHVAKYNDKKDAVDAIEHEIVEMEKQMAIDKHEKKDVKQLLKQITDKKEEKAKLEIEMNDAESAIKQFQVFNENVYDSYKKCHDKNGNLTHGTKEMPTTGYYVSFQMEVAPDMERIYNDFESMMKNDVTKEMFSEHMIALRMKSKDWPKIMRDLKRLDLYLSLFEQDTKLFKPKGKNVVSALLRDRMKDRESDSEDIKKELKKVEKQIVQLDKKEKTEAVNEEIEALERRKRTLTEDKKNADIMHDRYVKTHAFIHVVKMDIRKEDKSKSTVAAVHRYVKLMYATLMRYGVHPDGKLMNQVIDEAANKQLNQAEIKQIEEEQEARGAELLRQIQGKKTKTEQAEEYNKEHEKEIEKEKKAQKKREEKEKKKNLKNMNEINIAMDAIDNAEVVDLRSSGRDSIIQ